LNRVPCGKFNWASCDFVNFTPVPSPGATPVKYPKGFLLRRISRGKPGSTGQGGRRSEIRDIKYRKTWDIIEEADKGLLPNKVMLNVHPQRWSDNPVEWIRPGETLLRRMLSACFTG